MLCKAVQYVRYNTRTVNVYMGRDECNARTNCTYLEMNATLQLNRSAPSHISPPFQEQYAAQTKFAPFALVCEQPTLLAYYGQ